MTKKMAAEIVGRQVALPDERSVFVGEREGDNSYYLQFKNKDSVMRFTLSQEAAVALRALLYTGDGHGEPRTYKVKAGEPEMEWQIVRKHNA